VGFFGGQPRPEDDDLDAAIPLAPLGRIVARDREVRSVALGHETIFRYAGRDEATKNALCPSRGKLDVVFGVTPVVGIYATLWVQTKCCIDRLSSQSI